MAKANKKATKATENKQMTATFDELITILSDMATHSEEIMPLLSASLELSIRIVRTYKKAFIVGKKYAKLQ